MNLKFGFELEGFYKVGGEILLPPVGYSTDGFPGLCEVRTIGGAPLEDAYFYLLNEFRKTPFDIDTTVHTFTPEQKRKIRGRQNVKDGVDIQNIYGKEPRELGAKTLASFQINISNQTHAGGHEAYLSGNTSHVRSLPVRYGVFDYLPIIRALDEEFKLEIKDAKRQPGFYALKDGVRIEYRSLPNSVFEVDLNGISTLLNRLKKAIF